MAAVGASRTLAEWVDAASAPLAFHRTVVARDLETMLAGWQSLPPGWGAVTASGDLADSRGVVVLRGRADPPGGAAVRAHARRRELADTVTGIERELAGAQSAAHAAAERLRIGRDAHLAARDAHDDADRALRAARAELETATDLLTRTSERSSALEAELADIGDTNAADAPSADGGAPPDAGARSPAASGGGRPAPP